MTAPHDLSLYEARNAYFEENGFGPTGGYTDTWVTIAKLGPMRLGFPNTAARVRAVRYHDLHHVLTGYRTDLLGEAEIAAWELASGCKQERAAWILNLLAMPMGVLRHRARIERAFARGEHSRNLYGETYDDALLEQTVGEARERLEITPPADAPPLARNARLRLRRLLAVGLGLNALILVTLLTAVGAVVWLGWWLFG